MPLQRRVRTWVCRQQLRRAAKLALTAEAMREGRRRNRAAEELLSSEAEHVARLELCARWRTAWRETFAPSSAAALSASSPALGAAGTGGGGGGGGSGRHVAVAAACARVFVGLDEVLVAGKALLFELRVRRNAWPSDTRLGDLIQQWSFQHLLAYKTFVNNYDVASAALLECRNKRAFVEWEQKVMQCSFLVAPQIAHDVQMIASGLPTLDSLLICPVQRPPRYRLLLEAVLALTPEARERLRVCVCDCVCVCVHR